MNRYLILLVFLVFICCSGAYEQKYDTYGEFFKVSQRNKGWFPDVIFSDATNLKSCSYLSSTTIFGSFNYANSQKYDSIFSLNEKVNTKILKEKLSKVEALRPNWFEKKQSLNFDKLEVIKFGYFYLAKDKTQNKILFFRVEN